jgi:hypothetical protein
LIGVFANLKAVSDEKEHCQEGDLLKLVRIAFPNEWPFSAKEILIMEG